VNVSAAAEKILRTKNKARQTFYGRVWLPQTQGLTERIFTLSRSQPLQRFCSNFIPNAHGRLPSAFKIPPTQFTLTQMKAAAVRERTARGTRTAARNFKVI
jgi:hypothetical protein